MHKHIEVTTSDTFCKRKNIMPLKVENWTKNLLMFCQQNSNMEQWICYLINHQPWVWIHQLFRSVLHIEQNSKVIKGSIKCSIPVSSQVPLSNQQDEEVAVFLRQFKTRLAILKKNIIMTISHKKCTITHGLTSFYKLF